MEASVLFLVVSIALILFGFLIKFLHRLLVSAHPLSRFDGDDEPTSQSTGQRPTRTIYSAKEPPIFDGDPTSFKEWSFSMDLTFRTLSLDNPTRMVDCVPGHQTGNAGLWPIASLEAGKTFPDWPSLRNALARVYGPLHNQEVSSQFVFSHTVFVVGVILYY